ncbi:MAG TPA: GC-type dockerin domain-anchored protein [Phycisphaerales bacterium]|nr:GC-type dockerin domain-anchored protein [Phycisphaerales bacterium]
MRRAILPLVLGLMSACTCPALAQGPRNHEPFNLMGCNQTNRSVALVNSVVAYVMDDNFIPFAHYGLAGTPFDATNVWRQVWVTNQQARAIHRFAADIDYPPDYYGNVEAGPLDQVRGMEYVGENFTVYVCHSGTANGAPGDRILMFDVTGQPVGSFPASNPMDIMWSPERGELLVTNATHDSIDRYTLSGTFLGRLVDSDGISSIDRPMQMSRNHHSGEVIVSGADAPAGLYNFAVDGEETAFYPQTVGNPTGMIELDNEIKHGLWAFTTQNGLYTYWTDSDELITIRSGESWAYLNKIQFFCWADYDRSDFVDTDDFTAFVLDFEAGLPQADFDGSGFVDLDDYVYFLERFIDGC